MSQVILAAISGVVLVVLIVAFVIKSNSRSPLAQAALDLLSTDALVGTRLQFASV